MSRRIGIWRPGLLLIVMSIATTAAADANTAAAASERRQCTLTDDLLAGWPDAVRREQEQLAALPPPPAAASTRVLAAEILDAPEFGHWQPHTEWHLRWRFGSQHEEPATANPDWPAWLRWLGKVFAGLSAVLGTLGHVLLWLVLLVLLILLWRHRHRFRPRGKRAGDDAVIAGLAIAPLLAPDALPDDVVAGAEHLWQAGHARAALSLLYRAALHRLSARLAFAIPESGTETECLALVRRQAPAATGDAFRLLVNAWMQLAWQHRPPAELAPLLAAYRRAVADHAAPAQPGRPATGGAA